MAESKQDVTVSFPGVPREHQSMLIGKVHTLICEMEDLYQVSGNFDVLTVRED